LRLVGVHAGGVRLEGCDGAGRGGQSISVITRAEGTSCREGMGGVVGSGLIELDVVRQW